MQSNIFEEKPTGNCYHIVKFPYFPIGVDENITVVCLIKTITSLNA